jgi:hypothetical protein
LFLLLQPAGIGKKVLLLFFQSILKELGFDGFFFEIQESAWGGNSFLLYSRLDRESLCYFSLVIMVALALESTSSDHHHHHHRRWGRKFQLYHGTNEYGKMNEWMGGWNGWTVVIVVSSSMFSLSHSHLIAGGEKEGDWEMAHGGVFLPMARSSFLFSLFFSRGIYPSYQFAFLLYLRLFARLFNIYTRINYNSLLLILILCLECHLHGI